MDDTTIQNIKGIVFSLVQLMQNTKIWHGITWWDITISTLALSIGISLYKFWLSKNDDKG